MHGGAFGFCLTLSSESSLHLTIYFLGSGVERLPWRLSPVYIFVFRVVDSLVCALAATYISVYLEICFPVFGFYILGCYVGLGFVATMSSANMGCQLCWTSFSLGLLLPSGVSVLILHLSNPVCGLASICVCWDACVSKM